MGTNARGLGYTFMQCCPRTLKKYLDVVHPCNINVIYCVRGIKYVVIFN